jgi:predicted O-linked N-acetylglucosamine transferase (SPINDLY family)
LESNSHAHENLKTYARGYGVDAERIIFAAKVEFQEHISRHTIIDLFLDTYPYNAHTSASDALWAGCPILTMSGDTFASRVAGSILKEIGCDELITNDIEEYFKKALYLANNKKDLMELKNKITKGKTNSTLFKPKTFVKNLEDIYSSLLTT